MELINCKNNNKNFTFYYIFLIIVVFFIVFSIHLKVLEGFVSPRIIAMAVVVLAWFKYNKVSVKMKINDFVFLLSTLIVLFYTFAITDIRGTFSFNNLAVSSIINYTFMVCLLPFFFDDLVYDCEDFAKALSIATLIQSVIVIFSFLSPEIRLYLESIQTFSFERYSWRIVGLGIAGAGGSIYLFCGLITNLWLLKFRRVNTFFVMSLFFEFVAIILVGRTGFYVSVMFLAYYLITTRSLSMRALKFLGVIIFFICVTYVTLQSIDINSSLLDYTLGRLSDIFEERNALVTIASVDRPDFTWEMLWGIGLVRGYTSTGIRVFNDSGYIQKFMSIGYVFSLFYYVSAIIYLSSLFENLQDKKEKTFFYLLMLAMLVVEYKEPFMFALALPFTIIMMARLRVKDSLKEAKNVNKKYH